MADFRNRKEEQLEEPPVIIDNTQLTLEGMSSGAAPAREKETNPTSGKE